MRLHLYRQDVPQSRWTLKNKLTLAFMIMFILSLIQCAMVLNYNQQQTLQRASTFRNLALYRLLNVTQSYPRLTTEHAKFRDKTNTSNDDVKKSSDLNETHVVLDNDILQRPVDNTTVEQEGNKTNGYHFSTVDKTTFYSDLEIIKDDVNSEPDEDSENFEQPNEAIVSSEQTEDFTSEISEQQDEISVNSEQPDEISVNSGQSDEIRVNSEQPDKISVNSDSYDEISVNAIQPEEISEISEPPDKISANSKPQDEISVNSEQPDEISVNSEPSNKISVNSEQPDKISVNFEPPNNLGLNSNQQVYDFTGRINSKFKNHIYLKTKDQTKHVAPRNIRETICQNCFEHNFNMIINNEHICTNSEGSIDLVIVISTVHNHTAARDALRRTWLTISQNNTGNIRYVFLLGETDNEKSPTDIEQENAKYHDIIKEDFIDTYSNLTYKTVMGLKWVSTYCSHAKFFMKTDDDMFINLPNIMHYLKSNGKLLDNSLAGTCRTRAAPHRNPHSKWYASVAVYKEKQYPHYCSGTAYMTSVSLAKQMFTISSSMPFFHLEDIYIGLCLRRLGGSVINVPGFNLPRSPRLQDACLLKGRILFTAHRITPSMLHSIWRKKC